jgi:predicted AAA+ superfamily ATPase
VDIAIQNPHWQFASAIESDDKVKEALEKSPFISLYPFPEENILFLGPRQVGKTTQLKIWIYELIRQNIPPRNILYFTCEPLKEKNDLIQLLTEFDILSRAIPGRKYVFLDEITYVTDWEIGLKYILESALGKDKIIVTTGSNASALKSGVERLPGRNIKIRFFLPLSFREYVEFFGTQELKATLRTMNLSSLDLSNRTALIDAVSQFYPYQTELLEKLYIFFQTGGYIKSIFEYHRTNRIQSDTYETYAKWILGDLSKFDRKEEIFRSVISGIIRTQTSRFSLNSFSKDLAIPSHVTTQDYLSLLENLILIHQLFQCDPTTLNTLYRKERKVYFRDPFLYSVFKGYVNGYYKNYSEGEEPYLVEGIICDTLSRIRAFSSPNTLLLNDVWFFSGKKETDFVVKNNPEERSMVGIEVKWQPKVTIQDFYNQGTFRNRILLSKQTVSLDKETLIIPACLFLVFFKQIR